MIVEPKVRGFICTTAHPAGCEVNVRRQIEYVKKKQEEQAHNEGHGGPKRVLIIGASTGYGLASRIAAAYMWGAATIGVMYEKEANPQKGKDNQKNTADVKKDNMAAKRTATPGYYNTKAFEKQAHEDGYYAESVNGDAFSEDVKIKVVEMIREGMGKADMVIYSLAAPRRTDKNQVTYTSVLKTVGEEFTSKSLDMRNNEIKEFTVMPADEGEAENTVKVMGGEDWMDWITLLAAENVLEEGAVTFAYSYIGPELTYPIYKDGTIGIAKEHLYKTAYEINEKFMEKSIKAYVSVNKALVTQASAAIPIVPLYISILYRVMKEKGLHEGCIEQIERLFRGYVNGTSVLDAEGRIRIDDYEMREDVQKEVKQYWEMVDSGNVRDYADIDGYWEDFYHMFGFGFDEVDYALEVEV